MKVKKPKLVVDLFLVFAVCLSAGCCGNTKIERKHAALLGQKWQGLDGMKKHGWFDAVNDYASGEFNPAIEDVYPLAQKLNKTDGELYVEGFRDGLETVAELQSSFSHGNSIRLVEEFLERHQQEFVDYGLLLP